MPQGGGPTFQFTARLAHVPSPCLSCQFTRLLGGLDDGIGPGPDYWVRGTSSGVWLSGQGSFQALVFEPPAQPMGQAELVGRMRGRYDDPPALPGPGNFQGNWIVCP